MLNNRIANINKNGNYIPKYLPILLWCGASAGIPFDEQIKKNKFKRMCRNHKRFGSVNNNSINNSIIEYFRGCRCHNHRVDFSKGVENVGI